MSVAGAVTLERDNQMLDLKAEVELLSDPKGELDYATVSSQLFASKFHRLNEPTGALNLGFTDSTYWLRLNLRRSEDAPVRWWLEIPNSYIDYIDLYTAANPPVITGQNRPMSSRPMYERYFVFPLDLDTTEKTVYLRVSSSHTLTVPLQIWRPEARSQSEGNALLWQYLYFGSLLTLTIYNLLIASALKDTRFLLYVLYALPLGLGMLAGNGLGRVLLWPDALKFDEIAQSCLLAVAGSMSALFSRAFLKTRIRRPYADKVLLIFSGVLLLLALWFVTSLWWAGPINVMNQALFVVCLPFALLMLTLSVSELLRGERGVLFFVLGNMTLCIGVVVASLRGFGLLPTNVITAYSAQLSSIGEMFLVLFALVEIVGAERRIRVQAQAEVFETNQRTEQRLEREVTHEREMLLKDMHDGFGSQLNSARMMIEKNQMSQQDLITILQECMADLYLVVDTISYNNATLNEALIDYRYRMTRRMVGQPVTVHWEIDMVDGYTMNQRMILQVLRIIQEALNNALRHAHAKNIWISARCHINDQLVIKVCDDGVGIGQEVKRNKGLNNMTKRAREIDAALTITDRSPTSHGTEVSLVLIR